jgi:flagellar basal body-associated protein FliL
MNNFVKILIAFLFVVLLLVGFAYFWLTFFFPIVSNNLPERNVEIPEEQSNNVKPEYDEDTYSVREDLSRNSFEAVVSEDNTVTQNSLSAAQSNSSSAGITQPTELRGSPENFLQAYNY